MRELSLHIMDLTENSIRAGSTLIEIEIAESRSKDLMTIKIKDNGCGMDKEFLKDVISPFKTTRTTRKVGLGLSLFQAACQRCEGSFQIRSKPGIGTEVEGSFKWSHIDRAPLGDIASTLALLISGNPGIEFVYRHTTDEGTYILDSRELKQILEDVAVNNPLVVDWIKKNVKEGLKDINGGV